MKVLKISLPFFRFNVACLLPMPFVLTVFTDGTISPLPVLLHGICGTQNINNAGKKVVFTAGTKKLEHEDVSFVQITDSAKLDPKAQKLRVSFELRFIDLSSSLYAWDPGKEDSVEDLRAIDTWYSIAKAVLNMVRYINAVCV